jgi:hypothetical protein
MADSDIPATLIAAQRDFDAAHNALMNPAKALSDTDRQEARAKELAAALALQAARHGTPWATVSGQQKLRDAARGQA